MGKDKKTCLNVEKDYFNQETVSNHQLAGQNTQHIILRYKRFSFVLRSKLLKTGQHFTMANKKNPIILGQLVSPL